MSPQPDRDHGSRSPDEMRQLLEATDWSATPLGPVASWPKSLQVIVDTAMSSRIPMLVCWGPDLVMVYNDGYRSLLGQTKHPAAWGRSVRDVWPEVWDVIGPMFEGVLAGGPATWVEDELLVVDRNGFLEEAYFTWTYGAIHDEEGGVAGILNVATETTTKVLVERRAVLTSELLALVAHASNPAEVRERALRVLRSRTVDHLDADLVWEAGDSAQLDRPGVHVVPVVEPGRDEPSAHLVLTENPRRPWDSGLQAYAELCASHIASVLGGLRHLDDERGRAQSLVELDVAKSEFFANVSHELRTPLTLIAGPVHDALLDPDLEAGHRRRLEMVRANTERLSSLVDRILDLTRVEAGAVEAHRVAADVEELTRGIAASFRPAIERLGLVFDVECEEVDSEAYVDVDMFERILLNLLSNALKFTPRGRISLRLRTDSDGYAVSVTDTGIGIAERDLDRVFDRFHQLDRRDERRSREGAGIGLPLVKQLVGLLDGTITVTSTEGSGSTFTVHLPWGSPSVSAQRPSITPRPVESFLSEVSSWGPGEADEADEGDGADRAAAVEPARGAAATGEAADGAVPVRSTLLVVEDNRDMRDYLARHLVVDYDVVSARDGVEALALMRSDRPSIVLADVMMPRMDGLTLVREIRDDPDLRDLPVVLLSAKAGVEASTTGLLEGADDYVVKPFEPEELRARLAANLVRSRSRSRDAAWLRAIVSAIQDPFVISDAEGRVLEMNAAFTRTFGWSLADGPYEPPYPWWVPADESPEERRAHEERFEVVRAGQPVLEDRYRILRRGGGDAWVHVRAASIPGGSEHPGFLLAVVTDETREHESRMRRELAARIAVDLAAAEDLDQALATAVTGFTVLFDGEVTLRVRPDHGEAVLLSPRGRVAVSDLDAAVRRGLGSTPYAHDALVGEKREGLLLLPTAQQSDCRAWVQFDEPRLVSSDELVVGDLLAQTFGQAVDRVIAEQAHSEKEHQLGQAIESHRLVGHAVGVLMERHRVTAKQGFEMLRQASLNRNIKLREIAARVVESGEEPDRA